MIFDMSSKKFRHSLFLQLMALVFISAVSCNSKADDQENDIVVTPATVAVRSFSLMKNDSVIAHLDSVFFSIDLNTGVIFNADSLPKGTKVDRLIPAITFANTMSKAEITFLKDNLEDTTVDYLTNATDSIDFTHPVKLNVTAQDGVNSFTYTIKVNVHTVESDTLIWNKWEVSALPARTAHPVAQKTVNRDNDVYCLIEEQDGSFTLSSTSSLDEGNWDKMVFSPGFTPDVETFTVTPDAFYIMTGQGDLYTSADLTTWTSTGENWVNILGAYGDAVLGIKNSGSAFMHTMYPMAPDFTETPLESNFPLFNTSALGQIESQWADNPIAILTGGMTQGGEVSSAVWAYDGDRWAVINESSLPALEKPMLVRYVVFRQTPAAFKERQFDVWLLFGGYSSDSEMNPMVYMSYDNGVNWSLAPEGMQLSKKEGELAAADVIINYSDLEADLSDAWSVQPATKAGGYVIEGTTIYWMCPYLYIFGGYTPYPDNSLNTSIYRGVLQRLKFTPLI